jgi:hypothetical protein
MVPELKKKAQAGDPYPSFVAPAHEKCVSKGTIPAE